MMNAHDTTHGIEDHLEYGLWAQTCADHIGDGLIGGVRSVKGTVACRTLAAVIFEICAFLPDCLSGAVSGKCVYKHSKQATKNSRLITKTGICPACILAHRRFSERSSHVHLIVTVTGITCVSHSQDDGPYLTNLGCLVDGKLPRLPLEVFAILCTKCILQ